MKRKMYEIDLDTSEDSVSLSQDDGRSDPSVVAISVDQIDVVCKWLADAKREIEDRQAADQYIAASERMNGSK